MKKFCTICERYYTPIRNFQRYCYQPDCNSRYILKRGKGCGPRRANKIRPILKTYEKMPSADTRSACKLVICDEVDKYRDMLLDYFKGMTTIEEFNDLRRKAMKGKCGQAIHQRAFAGGIFYIAVNGGLQGAGYKSRIKWRELTNFLDVAQITMRKYAKWAL